MLSGLHYGGFTEDEITEMREVGDGDDAKQLELGMAASNAEQEDVKQEQAQVDNQMAELEFVASRDAAPDIEADARREKEQREREQRDSSRMLKMEQDVRDVRNEQRKDNERRQDERRDSSNTDKEQRLMSLGLRLLPSYTDTYYRKTVEEKISDLIKKDVNKEKSDSEMLKLVKLLIKKSAPKKKSAKKKSKKKSKKSAPKKKPKKSAKKKSKKKKSKK